MVDYSQGKVVRPGNANSRDGWMDTVSPTVQHVCRYVGGHSSNGEFGMRADDCAQERLEVPVFTPLTYTTKARGLEAVEVNASLLVRAKKGTNGDIGPCGAT